jgi:hypothetical protein
VRGGWLIDSVRLDDRNQLVHLSARELSDKLHAREKLEAERGLAKGSGPASWRSGLADSVLRYSLTANLVRISGSAAWRMMRPASTDPAPPATRNLYLLSVLANGRYWYEENPYARQNQDAMLALDDWARRHAVPFAVVLIPRNRGAFDPGWFEEVRGFLGRHRIRFVDLTLSFLAQGLDPRDLYWRTNAHFNVRGNREVANAVLRELPEFFPSVDAR